LLSSALAPFVASKRCNKHAAEAVFHAWKVTFARRTIGYGAARAGHVRHRRLCNERLYNRKAAMLSTLTRCLASRCRS